MPVASNAGMRYMLYGHAQQHRMYTWRGDANRDAAGAGSRPPIRRSLNNLILYTLHHVGLSGLSAGQAPLPQALRHTRHATSWVSRFTSCGDSTTGSMLTTTLKRRLRSSPLPHRRVRVRTHSRPSSSQRPRIAHGFS